MITIITGKPQSGKSKLSKAKYQQVNRAFVYDPLNQYEGTKFDSMEAFFEAHARKIASGKIPAFHCSFTFPAFDEKKFLQEVDFLFQAVWSVGKMSFFVEEANTFFDSRRRVLSWLNLASRAANRNIHLVLIAQRIREIPPTFRDNNHEIYCFRQDSPEQLEELAQWGFDPEAVKNLRQADGTTFPQENIHYLLKGK